MTGKKPIKDYELKKSILIMEQEGCCAHCGELFEPGQKIDLSHRIPRDNYMIKTYGYEVADHLKNLGATHQNGYKGRACNDAIMISRATRPIAAEELIKEILLCLKS